MPACIDLIAFNKSSALLKLRSSFDFNECVKHTIEWYENYYLDNENVQFFTEKQIDFYQNNSEINY